MEGMDSDARFGQSPWASPKSRMSPQASWFMCRIRQDDDKMMTPVSAASNGFEEAALNGRYEVENGWS
jgi:hypothetical protein